MKKAAFLLFLMLAVVCFQTGCVGYGLPHIFNEKPFTLLRGGDQFGRDILANRLIVANHMLPIKDMHKNEVLTILGEPQTIDITARNISEDWHYIYYKRYKTWPDTGKGVFLVRFYHDKVIDVVKV
ncbi:MAG: hypothetical protein JW893_09195 [Candidatus Omnitrophica bacterium]|nr:hypothetical protein [Candidatus Omnitrophota bacterium]